jgi:hypothetical protein
MPLLHVSASMKPCHRGYVNNVQKQQILPPMCMCRVKIQCYQLQLLKCLKNRLITFLNKALFFIAYQHLCQLLSYLCKGSFPKNSKLKLKLFSFIHKVVELQYFNCMT